MMGQYFPQGGRRGILWTLGTTAVAAVGIALWRRWTAQRFAARFPIMKPDGISLETFVTLGGIPQFVQIRGQSRDNPMVLFIHGGPGLSLLPFAHVLAPLEADFTVVHWDQRGAGRSYRPGIDPSTMTMAQLLADAEALVQWLRIRFQQPRILVAGHSLGTVTAMRLAQRIPEAIAGVVGIGQVVDKEQGERISYAYAYQQALQAGNDKHLRELMTIGPPPYHQASQIKRIRKIISAYGGNWYGTSHYRALLQLALQSPTLSPRRVRQYIQGLHFSLATMWFDATDTHLISQVPQVQVPVAFFIGRHDWVAPTSLVEAYYRQMAAPAGKRLVWFDNAAHWPMLEDPQQFIALMQSIRQQIFWQHKAQPALAS